MPSYKVTLRCLKPEYRVVEIGGPTMGPEEAAAAAVYGACMDSDDSNGFVVHEVELKSERSSHILVHGVWIENIHNAEPKRPPMWPVWVEYFYSLSHQGRDPNAEWQDRLVEAKELLEDYEWSVIDDR